jgi:uncharacterized protein YoxC
MSAISEWVDALQQSIEVLTKQVSGIDTTTQEWDKRIDTIAQQAENLRKSHMRMDARFSDMIVETEELKQQLNTLHVFSKQVLIRLTKLEDWKQDCESEGVAPAETPSDPFGKFADKDIDSPESRKDDYQPKRDVTVRRNARPASPPELVEGFWYVDANGTPVHRDLIRNLCSDQLPIRPATLDDLAHEVEGFRFWLVESKSSYGDVVVRQWEDSYGTDDTIHEYHESIRWTPAIAREYATACHIPIITKAQWELLTKETEK